MKTHTSDVPVDGNNCKSIEYDSILSIMHFHKNEFRHLNRNLSKGNKKKHTSTLTRYT